MNIPFTDRTLRASWQQITVYLSGFLVLLSPEVGLSDWIVENAGNASVFGILVVKWISLLRIIIGGLLLAGARSFIQRKDWTIQERTEKTVDKGIDTPPSK